MKFLQIFSILILLTFAGCYAVKHSYRAYPVFSGETMGTYYMVKINSSRVPMSVRQAIKKELKAVNGRMSVFDKNSEISRINAAPAGEWIELSPEMAKLMKTAFRIYKESRGTFDPSVGRLVELWGFGPQQQTDFPGEDEIRQALTSVGFDKLEFSEDFSKLRKNTEGMELNLSAIAKGYGVDRIAELLIKKQFKNFLIDIGGEVRALGRKNEQTPGWIVGIAHPDGTDDSAEAFVLKDMAAATSGDYINYKDDNGHRRQHTISPQSGLPVEDGVASVTVIASTCMEADAYATALMGMPAAEGLAFAKKHKLPVVIFTRSAGNKRFERFQSPEFKKLRRDEKNGHH